MPWMFQEANRSGIVSYLTHYILVKTSDSITTCKSVVKRDKEPKPVRMGIGKLFSHQNDNRACASRL
jgi:hypothetical protein